jgi:hypothetical protein
MGNPHSPDFPLQARAGTRSAAVLPLSRPGTLAVDASVLVATVSWPAAGAQAASRPWRWATLVMLTWDTRPRSSASSRRLPWRLHMHGPSTSGFAGISNR